MDRNEHVAVLKGFGWDRGGHELISAVNAAKVAALNQTHDDTVSEIWASQAQRRRQRPVCRHPAILGMVLPDEGQCFGLALGEAVGHAVAPFTL